MKELRQFERFVLNAPTTIFLEADNIHGQKIKSMAHDISSGGAFIEVKQQELLEKKDINVEFIISIATIKQLFGFSSKVKINAEASIIRRTETGVAVSFNGKNMKLSTA